MDESLVQPVHIREVYQENLEFEFDLIDSVLLGCSFVSIDTEFSGIIFKSEILYYQLSAGNIYELMKKNVDGTKLIQLGLTLSDANGNLPTFNSSQGHIWQFNFNFDVDKDAGDSKSIDLLKEQGVQFDKHKTNGIASEKFGQLFMRSRLGLSARYFFEGRHEFFYNPLTWVTFQGLYDLGYLIANLTHNSLPMDRIFFTAMVRVYCGMSLFDVKEIMKPLGLRGGLNKIAEQLGISRIAGKSHQAGSDSLLTMQVFLKIKEDYFVGSQICQFTNRLNGLEDDESAVMKVLTNIKKD